MGSRCRCPGDDGSDPGLGPRRGAQKSAKIGIAIVQLPTTLPSGNTLAAIVILAVVCTAAAFLVFAALIAEIGPVRATVITYVNPGVAAVLGVMVLHETFTVPMAVGFVLVIAGSVLATRRSQGAPGARAASINPGVSQP